MPCSRHTTSYPSTIRIRENGQTRYVDTAEALENPELHAEIGRQALVALAKWRSDYGDLLTLIAHPASRLVRSIDRLRQQMGQQWPSDE